MPKGSLFVVSAPAGTGKTTLVDRLCAQERSVVRSISLTTRLRRPHEQEGIDYYFVSNREFLERVDRGELMEWVQFQGDGYGTLAKPIEDSLSIGHSVILVIDVQGALQLMKTMSVISIFLMPPSFAELERRLALRKTESPEQQKQRLHTARKEMEAVNEYDFCIVNDQIDHAYDALRAIIIAERHRLPAAYFLPKDLDPIG